jgi:hypothetical protein
MIRLWSFETMAGQLPINSSLDKSLGREVSEVLCGRIPVAVVIRHHLKPLFLETMIMMKRMAEASPRLKARMAGIFYVLTGATYVFGQAFILGKLVVQGDAAATANNILAHQPFFQLGFTADLISVACSVALTVLFYDLFKPVNRSLSLLAAFLHLVGLAVAAFGSFLLLAPVVVLGGGQYLTVFKVDQLQALAYMFLELNAQAWNAFLVFFGFYCVLIGYLVFKSTFLPRLVGVLMACAGLGYLTLLYPPLAARLSPYNLAPAALGELSLMLWLLVMGVNVPRWKEQAATIK